MQFAYFLVRERNSARKKNGNARTHYQARGRKVRLSYRRAHEKTNKSHCVRATDKYDLNVSVRSFLFRILAVAFHIRVHNIVFHIVHYILAL